MGWWSEKIMGGDEPLDIEGEIMDILGYDVMEMTEDDYPRIGELLTVSQCEIFEKLDTSIGRQVLAYWMMKTGATFGPDMKNKIISSCKEDEWAKINNKRKGEIDNLCDTMEIYEGVPIEIPQTGLFDVILGKKQSN